MRNVLLFLGTLAAMAAASQLVDQAHRGVNLDPQAQAITRTAADLSRAIEELRGRVDARPLEARIGQ
jgi:hypothetical protein